MALHAAEAILDNSAVGKVGVEGKEVESLDEARQQAQSLDEAREQVLAEAGQGRVWRAC